MYDYAQPNQNKMLDSLAYLLYVQQVNELIKLLILIRLDYAIEFT